MDTDGIAQRLAAVRQRMSHAARRAGRDPREITLVAVGKTHHAAALDRAVAAGATDLGENRVQEAAAKIADVRPARWHLIGPLQRNKARKAVEIFDVIHTLDRPELAQRLQLVLEQDRPERILEVLIEVNLAREPQKAGAEPEEVDELLEVALGCDRLAVKGLMAIPPYLDDPEASRPYFAGLRELRDGLGLKFGVALPHLSMGMSHDFEAAIEEGATLVRVGTAIFGARG